MGRVTRSRNHVETLLRKVFVKGKGFADTALPHNFETHTINKTQVPATGNKHPAHTFPVQNVGDPFDHQD